MRRIDPKRLDEAIESTVLTAKSMFHKNVDADDVIPLYAILCTVDPKTGKPVPDKNGEEGLAVIFIVPARWDSDTDKDQMAVALRMIAAAGEAVASVFCCDAWMVIGAAAKDAHSIRASEHPDRVEAMALTIERRGKPGATVEYHPYQRLDDGLVFGDSQRVPNTSVAGRFGGILPPVIDPPPDVLANIRRLINAGAVGVFEWTPL